MNQSYQGTEIVVDLILEQIKANITDTLAKVSADRADGAVTMESPKEYFIYEEPNTYRPPAVFVVAQDVDMRDNVMGGNHINAYDNITIGVVVEDRKKSLATLKAWRYQAALMAILHETSLTNADASVKVFLRVQRFKYSTVVSFSKKDADETFRKAVSLELYVQHVEALQGL